MAARRGRDEWSVNSGDKTFGHHLLTTEHVRALSQTADHWAIILHFESREEMPKHSFFRAAAMVDMFEQGKLCRATMMAGLRTSRCPSKEEGVPSCFFRTLDFLLQFVAAGNNYRAVTDKEIAKGFPPAGWCRPPVVAAAEDSDVAQLAALEGPSGQPEALELAPMADPIRLFYAARSWAYIYSYHIAASTIRVQIGAPPQDLYHLWHSGQVSEYTLAVGLLDDAPPTNLWCPPCVMMPLGALLYMHGHGRPYLPVELRELKEIRANGIMACGTRKDARPLALPAGVFPYAPEPEPKPYEQDDYEPQPERSSRNGGASGSSSRQMSRTTSSALGATASGGRGGNGGGGGDGNRQTSNSGAASTAPLPLPPPPLELDPILDSAKWIMPAPFDTPLPPPPPETPAEAAPAAAAAEAPALPPSPFLGELNFGVQSTFETPPVRLFLGERGDAGLRGNWYFVEGAAAAAEQGGSSGGGGGGAVRGPYSPEQMLLSYVAGCRELHEETLVCGLDADVRPPAPPPRQAFQPLGSLLEAINAGNCYALVSATDLRSANSPLAQTLLGNRTRAPRPAATAAAAPSPSPTEPAAGSVAAAQPTVVRVGSVSAPTVVAPAVVMAQVPVVVPAAAPPPQQQPAMVQVQAQPPPPPPPQQQQQPQPVPQVQVQPLIQVQPQNQPPPTVRPMLVRPMQLPPHMGGPRPMMMPGGPPTMMYGGMMPPPGAVQPMQMQPGMMQPMQMQPGMVVQPMMMPQGMGQPQQMMMPGPGGMAPPRPGMYQA
ncbi:hypothetical protein HYH03_016001 [Edaphochlamys debaryana]|uniref:Uncharacterized protein n=1 Tax=Edaphochlamys debaryana TaxID=47281 RepID=A0A836BRV2_9CHLO|nr:hypothetical protein HYH03_016001 [Edaphochlamys debaryana]|eukprot:KAG2485214.1 hypothetical protein HYH03_016001 [Edaphochlamys debaryana]